MLYTLLSDKLECLLLLQSSHDCIAEVRKEGAYQNGAPYFAILLALTGERESQQEIP
jgi:hypothetical protein